MLSSVLLHLGNGLPRLALCDCLSVGPQQLFAQGFSVVCVDILRLGFGCRSRAGLALISLSPFLCAQGDDHPLQPSHVVPNAGFSRRSCRSLSCQALFFFFLETRLILSGSAHPQAPIVKRAVHFETYYACAGYFTSVIMHTNNRS